MTCRSIACMYKLMYSCCMFKRYSVAEARSYLPSIIDQAQSGQAIELTRRGKPVAVVVSCREFERLRTERPRFGTAYKSFLKKYSLDEIGVGKDFATITRDTTRGRKVSL
jgi:prevent-host-death family protein